MSRDRDEGVGKSKLAGSKLGECVRSGDRGGPRDLEAVLSWRGDSGSEGAG